VSAAGKPRVGTAPARFSFGGNDEEGTIPPFPADEWRDRAEIKPRSTRDRPEMGPFPQPTRVAQLVTASPDSGTRPRHVHDTSTTRPRQSETYPRLVA